MIEVNGTTYELKYNQKRIELIEAVTEKPVMAELQANRGMLGIRNLKVYFSYGLKQAGAEVFMAPKTGMEICEGLIESEGYAKVCGFVLEALERDCPFFFRAG